MLRLARKLGAQHGVLGGDAHGAGVGVALAHHDAAHGDERCGGKAKLLGAQQRGDSNVAARLHLTVGLQTRWEPRGASRACWVAAGEVNKRGCSNLASTSAAQRFPARLGPHLQHCTAAQVVGHQRLVRLGQAQLPRQARRLDGGPLGGASAAVVPGDQHMVGVAWQGGGEQGGGMRASEVVGSHRARCRPLINSSTQTAHRRLRRAPLTTPEATTPTPFSDTSLTDTRAAGLEDLRS